MGIAKASHDLERTVATAQRAAEEGLSGGPWKPKGYGRRDWDFPRALTPQERAEGLKRVRKLFGYVPRVTADGVAPVPPRARRRRKAS